MSLGAFSRLLQLDYAWRLGMEEEHVDSLVEEAREIATRSGDLRSLALLRMLGSARPGMVIHTAEWTAAAAEPIALADKSKRRRPSHGDTDRGLLRIPGFRRLRPS